MNKGPLEHSRTVHAPAVKGYDSARMLERAVIHTHKQTYLWYKLEICEWMSLST